MRMIRALRIAAVYLTGAALLLLLAAWIINLPVFDEQPDPQLQSLSAAPAMSAPEDNAFFALMGLRADADRDIVESGRKLYERYAQRHAETGDGTLQPEDFIELLGSDGPPAWTERYENCNHRSESSCIASMVEQVRASADSDPELHRALARYQSVVAMRAFGESGPFTLQSPLPPYGDFLELSRIAIARAWVDGDSQALAEALVADLRWWRRMLAQSRSVIGRMVAHAGARFDLQVINEAVRESRLSADELALVAGVLEPLDQEQLTLLPAVASEMETLRNVIDARNRGGEAVLIDGQSLLIRHFLQPQATMNLTFRVMMTPLLEAEGLDGPELALRYNSLCELSAETPSWSPASIYNPGGKYFAAVASAPLTPYLGRLHDFDAMLAATGLHVALAQSPGEQRDALIAQSLNPWTGQPFVVDDGRIRLSCVEPDVSCDIKLAQ